MGKAFDKIMAGLEEAAAIARGEAEPATYRVHVPEEIDVRAIRASQGLSQAQFADRYGFSAAAVRDWEQKRKRPEASARILLKIIERRPEVVQEALSAQG